MVNPGGEEKASIFFESGEMIHAEYGSLEGAQVIYQVFKKQEGFFQFSSGVLSPRRSIHSDWMSLVMEAARRFDDEKKNALWREESRVLEEKGVDLAQTKKKMEQVLEKNFGKKGRRIREELDRVAEEPGKLMEFCDKAEKYIFVFIDNRKAKEIAEELRAIIRADLYG